MTCKREVRRVRPRILLPVRSRERPTRRALVKRDEVKILVQSWVAKLGVQPRRVQKKRVQEDNRGFIRVETADMTGRGVGDVPQGGKVAPLGYIDIWHRCNLWGRTLWGAGTDTSASLKMGEEEEAEDEGVLGTGRTGSRNK